MNFSTLAKAVAGFAPTLATMLGGPLAGTAVSALEGALGLQKGSGPDAITQVLQTGAMTPETMAAVRAADQKHAEIIGQQGIDLAKLNAAHTEAFASVDAADVASARQRQIAVRDATTPALAWVVVGSAAALGAAAVTGSITKDPSQATLVGTVVGYMFSEAKQVLAYYFGSSRGSQAKDQLLLQATAPA